MIDLKIGDKVQIDPALVNGHAMKSKGVGTVLALHAGGTCCTVQWSLEPWWDDRGTWELALVSAAPGGAQ